MRGFESDAQSICIFVVRMLSTVVRVRQIHGEKYASHIKPWSVSDNHERLDGNNGLLLAPHIDHLFDKGYISFEDNGVIIVSKQTPEEILNAWSVKLKNVGSFNPIQRVYLGYHRKDVLKK